MTELKPFAPLVDDRTSMPLVYVAGPYRGKHAYEIEKNIRVVEDMGLLVAQWGAVPVLMHTMYRFFQGALPDPFWLGAGLDVLRRCHAILLVPGWERSSGSKAERAEAERIGIQVFVDKTSMFGSVAEVKVVDGDGKRLETWIREWKLEAEEDRK